MTEASPPRDLIVRVAARTDVGRAREQNEDAFVVADLTTMNAAMGADMFEHRPGHRGTLFMVADGMGGAAAGEVASQMATAIVLESLDASWRRAGRTDGDTFADALRTAVERANARIHRYAVEHPENHGMGTTTTLAGVLGETLYLCQVGDSRGYIVRGGLATQVTRDQSLVQRLVDVGEITAEEAAFSEHRNIILQALGPEPQVTVDVTTHTLRRGDTLVLCSDGLSGQVTNADIARIVSEHALDLSAACTALVGLANEHGGPDNITVITARFEGSGLTPPSRRDHVGHQPYMAPDDRCGASQMRAEAIADSLSDAALTELSMLTTDETPVPLAPNHDAAHSGHGAPARPPVRRLSVAQLRIIFGALTLVVAGWLLWVYWRQR